MNGGVSNVTLTGKNLIHYDIAEQEHHRKEVQKPRRQIPDVHYKFQSHLAGFEVGVYTKLLR